MRNRSTPAGLMVVALLWLGAVAAPGAAAVPDPSEPALAASPSTTAVPATTQVTGSCPAIGTDSSDDWVYPTSARLTFPAAGVTATTVDLDSGGEFTRTYTLPGTLAPAQYGLTLFCDNSEVGASVTVVPTEVPATLDLDRDSGEVGENVSATGTCPTSTGGVDLFVDAVKVGSGAVDSVTGAFGPVAFPVPDVDPGVYGVRTSCQARAPFEVLPTPLIPATLDLAPLSGRVGDDVSATGTCALSTESVTVFFGGRPVGSDAVDAETGEFGPVDFAVPESGLGPVTVATDCEAETTFTVTVAAPPPVTPTPPPVTPAPPTTTVPPTTTAPPTTTTAPSTPTAPSTTPPPVLIEVPDLLGMTEDEARAALGGELVLGELTGDDGVVRTQDPPPGTLVEPASAVSVVLDEPPRSLLWLLVPAVLVLAMVAGLVARERVRRRRVREERWVEEEVRTETQPRGIALSDVPDHAAPGVDLRVEVRRDPARL